MLSLGQRCTQIPFCSARKMGSVRIWSNPKLAVHRPKTWSVNGQLGGRILCIPDPRNPTSNRTQKSKTESSIKFVCKTAIILYKNSQTIVPNGSTKQIKIKKIVTIHKSSAERIEIGKAKGLTVFSLNFRDTKTRDRFTPKYRKPNPIKSSNSDRNSRTVADLIIFSLKGHKIPDRSIH